MDIDPRSGSGRGRRGTMSSLFFSRSGKEEWGENRGGRGAKSERVKKFSVLPLPSLLREKGWVFRIGPAYREEPGGMKN